VAAASRLERGAQQPRPVIGFRAQRDGDATARAGDAEIDIAERPLLAVALVVNREIAVLETDLAEITAIEAGNAQAVDPGEQRVEIRDRTARWRRRRRTRPTKWSGYEPGRMMRRFGGAGDRWGHRSGDERTFGGAGKHRHGAVLLDANLHLGADE